MMQKTYYVELDSVLIGKTCFENADPPMGVVLGKLELEGIESGYEYFSKYCKKHNIPTNEDDPIDKVIFTQSIDGLKIFDENRVEIKGQGACITGMDEEGYEIDVFGIPYPFYAKEFPHHRDAYDSQFK